MIKGMLMNQRNVLEHGIKIVYTPIVCLDVTSSVAQILEIFLLLL